MASSSRTFETCGEHKPSVSDKTEERLKRLQRAQWLRAAVLGVNDGLLSTTSLMLGVGAAKEDQWSMVLSGIAGAIAGACSMAVGEFVSVSTQRDIESSVIEHSNAENDTGDIKIQITHNDETKTNVLNSPAQIPSRILALGPNSSPFFSPAKSPMMKVVMNDARANTVQDSEEKGNNGKETLPNPYKAAAASAVAFLCGSFLPLLAAIAVADNVDRTIAVVIVASIALALFGGIGAFLGGLSLRVVAARVLLGGWISMAVTYGLLKPLDKDDKGGKDKNLHSN